MEVPPELDSQTKKSIGDIAKRAAEATTQSVENSVLEGTDGAGLLNKEAVAQAESGYGAVNTNQLDAIHARAMGKYKSAMNDLGVRERANAQKAAFQQKLQASDILAREREYNERRQAILREIAKEKKRARARTLGSIMSIAGGAAGMAATGGNPMGGAMGAQAGNAWGQAIGGGL